MSNTPLFTGETNIENVNYTETWMRERESWKPMRNLAGNNETFVKNWPHSQDKLVPIAKSVSVDTYTRKTDSRLRDDASNSEHLFFLNISARVIVTGTSLNLSRLNEWSLCSSLQQEAESDIFSIYILHHGNFQQRTKTLLANIQRAKYQGRVKLSECSSISRPPEWRQSQGRIVPQICSR